MRKPDSFTQKDGERPQKIRSLNKKYGRFWKNMPEFPPVFVQKIFCFVQIPKSFVQKYETTAEEAEGNTKKIFRGTA